MSAKAAIYCRISRDRDGEKLGVDRQEEDCRALAERLGWEVAEVYVDNDISAYSGKARPQYREMLNAVKAGRVQAVLAWHPDRLYRRAVDLEEIVNIAEAKHLQIATVTAGDVDLSTPGGRMNARIIAAVAQGEVENTRTRVRRKKQEMATAGKYRGGRRPFGYESDGVTIRENEAEALRYASKAILAGRSLRGVVNELNERGSRTSTDKPWDPHTLRPVLLRARNAGLVQRGPVWHREPDIVGEAEWPAIIDEEEWRAVHKLLTEPSRRSQQGSAVRWLGSGIFTCGIEGCGAVMRVNAVGATPARPNHKRVHHYRCSEKTHLWVTTKHADAYVLSEVAKIVRDPRIVKLMTAGEHDGMQADRERRTLLMERLEQIGSDYDDAVIDGRRWKSATAKVEAELAEVEERLAEGVQQAAVSPIFNAADPGAALLAAPLDIQRAVLRSVVRVEVLPATAPRRVWKNDRLRLSPVA